MWAISGSLKINRALTQEECDKILAEHNMAPQEWEQGKLNLADLGYTGEQNDAARKTLAPITYDDNGEIIPLSQCFNASKDDISKLIKTYILTLHGRFKKRLGVNKLTLLLQREYGFKIGQTRAKFFSYA